MVIFAGGIWLTRGEWLYPHQTQTNNKIHANLQDTTVGQTFVANQAGLEAVDILLDLPSIPTGSLTLHLRDAPNATQDIQQTTVLAATGLHDDKWFRFPLKLLPDSRSKYYYFFIEPSADFANEAVTIHYGAPDAYADGALYVNGLPQEGQLAFRLAYNRPMILYDLFQGIFISVPRAVISLLVFTLPGWALLSVAQIIGKQKLIRHWIEGVSAAVGLSMAIYPILFLIMNVLNWQPGVTLVWLVVGASVVILLWHYRIWQLRWQPIYSAIQARAASNTAWADIALIVILAAAAAARLFMVRGLEMPFWHDSVQHAIITQRIMETGGLFQSWLPYTPHTTFSFHFGYHLDTAVFGWVTRMNTPQAMLWGGQLFNLFAVFTLYALAYRLNGAWAGTIAVLVAGLFTQFPSYYTNWGRYPQMMGQAILPVAAWWTWITLRHDGAKQYTNLAWMIGGASLIASSILSYYRMSFHYLAFVIAALLVYAQSKRDLLAWQKWLTLAGTAFITAFMMLPWTGGFLAQMVGDNPSGTAVSNTTVSLWDNIASLSSFWFVPQLLLLLLGTLSILWWGRKAALPTLWFWMLMMLLIVKVTPLPGAAIISELTIHTSLYIPMALIWGTFVASMLAQLAPQWQRPLLLLVIVVAVIQLPKLPQSLVHEWDLSSRPDMQAAEWIKEALPTDAFFLIDGFDYKATPAASDAGWWLPLLTKRQTTIPPQYATFVEKPVLEGYQQITTQFIINLMAQPPTSAAGKAIICQFPYPITHVYIGQKRGMLKGTAADVTPERPLLPAQSLLEDPDFELLYQRDRVLIFAFNRDICGNGQAKNDT